MKKLLLLIALPFMFLTLSAQITQEQADAIVIEHIGNVASNFILYAKEDVQTGFEITTTTGEILELSYPCWVYYVHFTDETNGKYLIVKESNGNVLETNVKNDAGPDGLEDWLTILWYSEHSLTKTLCLLTNFDFFDPKRLIIINSHEDLNKYISCAEGNYPEVDFSRHTILLAFGHSEYSIGNISKKLLQTSEDSFQLNLELDRYQLSNSRDESWQYAVITSKLSSESSVELNVTVKPASCHLKNLNTFDSDILIVINSNEELKTYLECSDLNDFPEIDFTKHTLLLAAGTFAYGVGYVNKQLTKVAEKHYSFDIKILTKGTMGVSHWITRGLVAKLPADVVIALNVKYNP